jgi:hypothetical protein
MDLTGQGEAGTNGPDGAQGEAGANGSDGAQGEAGTNGTDGAQGEAEMEQMEHKEKNKWIRWITR